MVSVFARRLRKEPTEAEKKLWSILRRRSLDGHRFRRQVPIGPYIVDFACLAGSLIVELDGSQHAVDVAADAERTGWLESKGYRVLRFWNNDALGNAPAVVESIRCALRTRAKGASFL